MRSCDENELVWQFTWTQQVQICINVHSVYCVVDGTCFFFK